MLIHRDAEARDKLTFLLQHSGFQVLATGDVDQATMTLVENLCSERLPINEAVVLTMATKGPDPKHDAVLKYYLPKKRS